MRKTIYEVRDVFNRKDLVELYAERKLYYSGNCLFDLFQKASRRGGIYTIFSAKALKEAAAETFYMGYSKKADTLVFGIYMSLNGKDCDGYLAVKYQDDKFSVEGIHLHAGDFVFGNVLEYARTRFEDLKDLQMD